MLIRKQPNNVRGPRNFLNHNSERGSTKESGQSIFKLCLIIAYIINMSTLYYFEYISDETELKFMCKKE